MARATGATGATDTTGTSNACSTVTLVIVVPTISSATKVKTRSLPLPGILLLATVKYYLL